MHHEKTIQGDPNITPRFRVALDIIDIQSLSDEQQHEDQIEAEGLVIEEKFLLFLEDDDKKENSCDQMGVKCILQEKRAHEVSKHQQIVLIISIVVVISHEREIENEPKDHISRLIDLQISIDGLLSSANHNKVKLLSLLYFAFIEIDMNVSC